MGYYHKHNLVTLHQRISARLIRTTRDYICISFGVPPIGHGAALKYPDKPFLECSYERDKKTIYVDNLNERFIPVG
ncbi:MAG: hypothetical protein APF76_04640 [Desulfitibacter sp. BRH_c19]|nr:MAG: hypothetical protein APF76_04640 [Desulfitibacter sp. BRH_c19]